VAARFFKSLFDKTIGSLWLEVRSEWSLFIAYFVNVYLPELEERFGFLLACLFLVALVYIRPSIVNQSWFIALVVIIALWFAAGNFTVKALTLDEVAMDMAPELCFFSLGLILDGEHCVLRLVIWFVAVAFVYWSYWGMNPWCSYKRKIFAPLVALPIGWHKLAIFALSAWIFYMPVSFGFWKMIYGVYRDGLSYLSEVNPVIIKRHNMYYKWVTSMGLYVSNKPRPHKGIKVNHIRRRVGLRSMRKAIIHNDEWDEFIRIAMKVGLSNFSSVELNEFKTFATPWHFRLTGELGWIYDAVKKVQVVNHNM